MKNRFTYSVDYVLCDAEAEDLSTPLLFARNRPGVSSLHDSDHGGPPGQGRGATWVREVLAAHKVTGVARIALLAQPRVLGHVFNPVSFWLCHRADGALIAVIAEVTNTYGDRHSYLCHHPDLRPITARERLTAAKLMHVSPFQDVAGGYEFTFDIDRAQIAIRIDYGHGEEGLVATLTGPRAPLSNRAILWSLLRRPFGARRVLALIHWQALKLWWKGAGFRDRPEAPSAEVSRDRAHGAGQG